ncbi:hypothetical protein QE380_003691 [Acinetobacter baylyi]|uniref:Uncharacterized protein n=1 Tax=Acinetobacter baylyi TaxID=202950 RepID=A0ABU0V1J7_ACIBI|nr:hypothetical protein [Acinetobacter baylyi]MDQ1210672.1 hypothetical protein [Acinetobacter baylyi]MDR6104740.1 hypothetical protein [Acinetobacter baylyi]MDR6187708.1 hypothetical protein [Acinetobacter baylyi]MDR6187723.1 hypothetical protein [Acinetobacter baylyi]
MMFISIEKDNLIYESEYYIEENQVVVIGNRGQEAIDINGMKVEQAAKAGLRNLIRKKLIDPIDKSPK